MNIDVYVLILLCLLVMVVCTFLFVLVHIGHKCMFSDVILVLNLGGGGIT
jgi:hypothetical protein